jgi:hypothetical protein
MEAEMGLLVNILSGLKAAALGKEGWFFSTMAIFLTLFIPNVLRFVLGVFDSEFDSFMSLYLVGYEWRRWRVIDLPIYLLPFWIAGIVADKNEQIESAKSEWKQKVEKQERIISAMSDEIADLKSEVRVFNRRQNEFEKLKKLKSDNEEKISELMGDLKAAKNRAAEAEALLAMSEEKANEAVSLAEKALDEIASCGPNASKQAVKNGRDQWSIFEV